MQGMGFMRDRSSWIVRASDDFEPLMSLFCFPYAGVGPSVYGGWAEQLRQSGVKVFLIQPPGRESRLREEPMCTMSEIAVAAASAIAPLVIGRFAFYGHSLGAKIAFETAREMRRRFGTAPDHLFVSASIAPHLPWPYPPMHRLPKEQLLREVQHRYRGIPEPVLREHDLLDLLLPGLRADLTILETYSYTAEPPLPSAITAFGGLEDRSVSEASLQAWRTLTRSAFTIRMLPGGHFFLHSERMTLFKTIAKAAAALGTSAPLAAVE
jgi:surfactin synthase thioesterase subunit